MNPPKGLITFRDLDICSPHKKRVTRFLIGAISITFFIVILIIYSNLPNLSILPVIIITMLLIITFVPDINSLINTPLSVNLNHPCVDDEPIGDAVVSVLLTNGEWKELGNERVRLVEDDLVNGYNLVEDNDNYTLIGPFSSSSNKKRLQKQIIIINQALALRDMVNGIEDPIESARERENLDFGLLERDWMENEELEVEGPLAKIMSKE